MPSVSVKETKVVEKPTKAEDTKESTKAPREGALPVTLLSGFLGSGKTTLLKHVLENANGLRIGVLVNDVAALNIDAKLVANENKADKLVQLENGCICCTLRDPLMEHLIKMSQDEKLDYCIVESTGVAEPAPVAELFTFSTGEAFDEEENSLGDMPLSAFVKLDTCVTVVDAKNFPGDLETRKKAADRWKDSKDDPEGERDIAEILSDQLEFADVIVLNKCDLVSEEEAKRVEGAIKAFNGKAKILRAKHSAVEINDVVATGKFDLDDARQNAQWLVEMRKEDENKAKEEKSNGNEKKETHNTKSEMEEFGISSFVYRRRRPFHPNRFAGAATLLADMGNALLRSKGFVWIATRNEGYGEWSQTGAVWTVGPGGKWLCDLPKEEWPSDEAEFVSKVQKDMDPDPKIGDRRQEIVFIGQGLRKKEIVEIMDKCLLNDEEMKVGAEKWKDFKDPFEEWSFEEEKEEEEGGCGPQCEVAIDVDVPGTDAEKGNGKGAANEKESDEVTEANGKKAKLGVDKEEKKAEDDTKEQVKDEPANNEKSGDESVLGKRECEEVAKGDGEIETKRTKTSSD